MNDISASSLLDRLLGRFDSEEALDLEYKSAKGGLPKSLWETVSAFANTNGGWILLGVVERDGRPNVEGIGNPSALVKTIHDSLRNRQKISVPACGVNDVSVEPLGNQQIIVLRVPAASRRNRPVYINGNPYDGTYVRRHSGDYHCLKPEVDRMMREASDAGVDTAVLPRFDWKDLDPESIARYRRRFQTANSESPWNNYDDHSFLQALGGFRRDRESGEEGLTVAGLLLLGRSEALREWRTRHLIDYRLVSGDADSDVRWLDRVTWDGNLLRAFETIYPRLVSDLARPFRLEGGVRIEDSPVHVALREALVNLLVHADYAEAQASLVKRSPSGFYFRNPGSSRVLESDLLTGDRSDPRNPTLIFMFRRIGFADEAGTGIPKILRAWRELGFVPPAILTDTERYEFTLELRHVHLLSPQDQDWLRSVASALSEAERLALVLAKHEGEVSNFRLRTITGQHPADTTKVLVGLRDKGLLQKIGGKRWPRYQLGSSVAPASLSTASDPAVEVTTGAGIAAPVSQLSFLDSISNPVDADPNREGARASIEGLRANSEGSRENSEGLRANSEGSRENSEGLRANSEDLQAELVRIARETRIRRKVPLDSLAESLVQLCSVRPLSIRDLASLLDRKEVYLREILRPLLDSGRISYLHPEHKNHPRQMYTVKGSSPRDAISTDS